MELKKCPHCKRELPKKSFDIHRKETSGVFWICKECRSKYSKGKPWKRYNPEWRSRPEKYLSIKYDSIKYRIKVKENYKNRKVLFTRSEFIDFGMNNENYLRLHKQWIDSEFSKKKSPSVDRIDNKGDYSLDNIQFLTAIDNRLKWTH